MTIIKYLLLVSCTTTGLFFCKKSSSGADPVPPPGSSCMYQGVDTCSQHTNIVITVDPNNSFQSIHSFGASDAWTCKFYGNWSNSVKKAQIADWLFSTDTLKDGSPLGIGLSLWRFNIGGGSFEQGAGSNITDEFRREECFLDANGTYNWNKQSGQQWFLQAAKQRGVQYTLGFSLTPPVFMTKNGKAFNGSGGVDMNIQDGKMDSYAAFLAEVAKHFQFDYLSPVNEPQWSWGQANSASQEGTQATNNEIALLVKALSKKMTGSAAKIVVGEAGQLDFLYGRNNDGRGDQINQFFAPTSGNYIGDQSNVAHTISYHSYFTTCPDDNMVAVRKQAAAKVKQVDASLQTWQSEFGILGNICGQYSGSPRNAGIDYGLYVAKVIHHDLTVANVASWQWWLAVSPYNYSDALVYVNDLSGNINVANTKTDGLVTGSKQLWAFGNYARFVRPGMKRIATGVSGAENNLLVSAYKEETGNKLVVVIINPSGTEQIVQMDKNVSFTGNKVNAYTTNYTLNLQKSSAAADHISLPPKSIVTLTGSLVTTP